MKTTKKLIVQTTFQKALKEQYNNSIIKLKDVASKITNINKEFINKVLIGEHIDNLKDLMHGVQHELHCTHKYCERLLTQDVFKVTKTSHSFDVNNSNIAVQVFSNDKGIIYNITVRDYSIPNMKGAVYLRYRAKLKANEGK